MNDQPLTGLRVLDLGWILSIPHCTAWLGTLGADVIRVESMIRPDPVRIGLGGAADGIPGPNRAAPFNGLNYSKKSITLNIASPEGLSLAKELVKTCDVVCENYATGVLERLGLGYEALCAVKPDIILLSGSTLGQSGPEREATGWGPNAAAYAGLPFITGYRDGPPADLGGTWPDYCIGTMMVFALLSAVHHQRRTGQGQHVEIAMGEAVTAMIPEAVLEYTLNGRETPRRGNRDPRMAPHDVYPCAGPGSRTPHPQPLPEPGRGATTESQTEPGDPWSEAQGRASQTLDDDDKWVVITVADDAEWRALCGAIGRPELADDPRFAGAADRLCHQDELDELIAGWTSQRSPREVMQTLQAAGVAAGPVMNIFDLMEDPQVQARGFLVEMDHPEVGPRTVAGLPAHFGEIPELAYFPAPCLGQHNDEVFAGLLHLSRAEIERLQAAQVIY